MSEFNQEFNFHDSKIRNVIIAVVSEFQKKIKFKQYTSNNVYDIHEVPFYYSLTGAEDFLIDHFMSPNYSVYAENKLDKNYEPVPRGVMSLSSIEIDSGSLINKHIRTSIPKKVDETTYKMYSYETVIIPLNMSFEVRIICNSNLEMFKITEAIIASMYKTHPIIIDFGGYRVKGHVNLPESFEQEKTLEFTYSDKKQYDITFSVEVTTTMPIFDEKTEMFLGNRIEEFTNSIYDMEIAPDNQIESNTENNGRNRANHHKIGLFHATERQHKTVGNSVQQKPGGDKRNDPVSFIILLIGKKINYRARQNA